MYEKKVRITPQGNGVGGYRPRIRSLSWRKNFWAAERTSARERSVDPLPFLLNLNTPPVGERLLSLIYFSNNEITI